MPVYTIVTANGKPAVLLNVSSGSPTATPSRWPTRLVEGTERDRKISRPA
jgi:hypothetical protein